MTENLWGELPEPDKAVHPKHILHEQATVLADHTKGVLQADIRNEEAMGGAPRPDRPDFGLRFSIVCPSLRNYRVDILRIFYHMVGIYPAMVKNLQSSEAAAEVANNEAELKDAVANILRSEPVHNIIAALLRDAKS